MALKNPGELFGIERKAPKEPSVDASQNIKGIKEEFDKVEDLRKQLSNVSNSLNNSLNEVVDKNLNFLSNEYDSLLEKFNIKIDILKDDINLKVDSLKKSNQDILAEIEIVENRQKKNLDDIKEAKEEVLLEVKNILSGNVEDNINRLENKIEIIKEAYEENILKEGLLNEPSSTDNEDPLTPLDKRYATLDDLKQHYSTFLGRIQEQLSTLGGGGAVRIQDLDDVDLSTARVNNKFLKYDSASGKWVGSNASGGSGSDVVDDTTPQLGGNLDLNGKYITGTGGINVTGVVTATSFSGTVPSSSLSGALPALDGSALTNVTGSGSGVVIKDGGSTVGTAGTINFGDNLSVTPISVGIVTVTVPAGIGTANVSTNSLDVIGLSTHRNGINVAGLSYLDGDVSFVGDNSNALWDKSKSDLVLYDNTRLTLGSSEDFQIWHGTNSHIKNSTGSLRIRGDEIMLKRADDSEKYLQATKNEDVKLFYNNNEKFATTNTGVTVTGTVAATAFTGDGSALTGISAGALDSRGTTSASTGSIAQTASANITIPTRGKLFSLLKVAIDAPAWVVLYVDSASRTSDASRTEGTDPAPGSGVLTEVSTTTAGASTFLMTPAVIGWNNDGTPATQVYAKVTNKRSNSGSNTITVTLTTVKLEA